jgi:hypothetical protein
MIVHRFISFFPPKPCIAHGAMAELSPQSKQRLRFPQSDTLWTLELSFSRRPPKLWGSPRLILILEFSANSFGSLRNSFYFNELQAKEVSFFPALLFRRTLSPFIIQGETRVGGVDRLFRKKLAVGA